MATKAFRSEISIDIDCGAIAIVNKQPAAEGREDCVRESAQGGGKGETTHSQPPTAKLAKPAGGWDEDYVVNNFRV